MVLTVDRTEAVVTIVLDRPETRNAINFELASALVVAIREAQDARVIVLTGRDPAFCSGLDLRQLGAATFSELPRFVDCIADSRVPVVAAVNGAAATGGLEIALACDFIIASDRARFADTHLKVDVYPGPVLVDLPRRVGMAWARQMSLTGDFIDAATALRIGLANEVVPHELLLERAIGIARSIGDHDPEKVALMRRDWAETGAMPRAEAMRRHLELSDQTGLWQTTQSDLTRRGLSLLNAAPGTAEPPTPRAPQTSS
jgi:enoyl-CoA hydratase